MLKHGRKLSHSESRQRDDLLISCASIHSSGGSCICNLGPKGWPIMLVGGGKHKHKHCQGATGPDMDMTDPTEAPLMHSLGT